MAKDRRAHFSCHRYERSNYSAVFCHECSVIMGRADFENAQINGIRSPKTVIWQYCVDAAPLVPNVNFESLK